jgi:ABC-type transport system involved in multi-copper enzyme maturation permease subunit
MPIITLAKFTIRGYLKERILLVVLLFGFLLMAASYVLSPLAVGAQQKIVVDIGLSSISIFGVLLIVLLGAGSLYNEKERGILKTLLVKPITRADYILGKYGGTALTVIMVMVLMALVYLGFMVVSGATFTANIFWAIYLSLLEAAVLTSVLTLFASFSSPVLSSFFTICVAVSGHLAKDILEFAERFAGPAMKAFATVAYYALPNLSLFNIRQEAVHDLPLPDGFIYSATIYGVFYTLVLLFLSSLIFRRKEID